MLLAVQNSPRQEPKMQDSHCVCLFSFYYTHPLSRLFKENYFLMGREKSGPGNCLKGLQKEQATFPMQLALQEGFWRLHPEIWKTVQHYINKSLSLHKLVTIIMSQPLHTKHILHIPYFQMHWFCS